MNLTNLIKTAWYSIRAYRLRIFLTMIGIIIGISSVAAILAVGEGIKKSSAETMESSNLNQIILNYYQTPEDEMEVEAFSKTDIKMIEAIDGIQEVTEDPEIEGFYGGMEMKGLTYFNKSTYAQTKVYSEDGKKDSEILAGRYFTKEEGAGEGSKMILSEKIATDLFEDPAKAVGKGLTYDGKTYEVIGVRAGKGSTEEMNISMLMEGQEDMLADDTVIIPELAIVEEETVVEETIGSLSIHLEPGADKEIVIPQVKEVLKEQHQDLLGDYEEFDGSKMVEELQGMISTITLFISFVAGISLLVGGIGVMNIMYVSVTQRRREIGIRRAIGAKPSSILLQFLIESVFITGLGGIIGIILGIAMSYAIGQFASVTPIVSASNLLIASSISIIIGLVFGIVPARSASKLDPIKAIYK